MSARIAGFVVDKLSAAAELDGEVVHARLAGTAAQRDVAPLEGVFAAIHAACAARDEVREVVVDLRDLEYMSSSHLKTLVSWVGKMGALGRRVAVRVRSNPKYHWQKRSLHAVWHLAESFVTVE